MRRPCGAATAVALCFGLGAAPALAGDTTVPPAKAENRPFAVPFIHDDYPRALADAKAKKLPLFVEAWAPW